MKRTSIIVVLWVSFSLGDRTSGSGKLHRKWGDEFDHSLRTDAAHHCISRSEED